MAVFVRFVVVNGANTVLYYGLYLLLRLAMPYLLANVVALAVAILVAFWLNARFAFKVEARLSKLLPYALSNLAGAALRTLAVLLLVELAHMSEELAPLVATALTLPIAFLLTHLVMADRPGRLGRTADAV
nr:GtrA family protein [Motilibacter deserti]